MKVIHLNYADINGGAARAAYRIHHALRDASVDSQMWVDSATAGDWTVHGPATKFRKGLGKIRPTLGSGLFNPVFKTGNPVVHSPAILPSGRVEALNCSNADILHLHWVQGEMLSIADIGRLKKPIVWTLHDMWAFCGAEHYTEEFRWRDGYFKDTGGAGFLGSHLCHRLVKDGHDVVCADNFFTGAKDNISHLLGHPHFELMRHDVTFPLYVEVDEIYNLACPASPIHYQYDPVQTTKTCVHGAINMLGLAKRTKAKIFQASTSEVYGDPDVHPQPESYWGKVNPIGIRSCYDEGKRCAETLFFDYHRQYGVDIKVARIFNTYGPRMHPKDGRVVSNFIVQALKGENITIYGDGMQTRSFCYVDDLIEGFVRLMNTESKVTGPINLGNPGEFTMLDLAEKVLQLVGGKSKLVFLPLPADDPKQRQPDITQAKAKLDWQPKVALEDGLKETVDYFRKLLND